MSRPRALVVTAKTDGAQDIGLAAYSYAHAFHAFRPLLERYAPLVVIDRGESRLDAALDAARREERTPLHLSFLPLERVYPSSLAPTVAFPYWEFPDIPSRDFDDNPRNNWRRICGALAGGARRQREVGVGDGRRHDVDRCRHAGAAEGVGGEFAGADQAGERAADAAPVVARVVVEVAAGNVGKLPVGKRHRWRQRARVHALEREEAQMQRCASLAPSRVDGGVEPTLTAIDDDQRRVAFEQRPEGVEGVRVRVGREPDVLRPVGLRRHHQRPWARGRL